MQQDAKVYVAGHRGMVGSAIMRRLREEGFTNLVYRSSSELDLRDQHAVQAFFDAEQPDFVFLAAAKVGGILANNTYRAEFLYDNLMIAANVIHAAYTTNVEKLLFLGSSCIYPKLASQPLREDQLLTGPLEPTNEPYAIAKIAGIKLCDAYRAQYGCNFISAMPCNLYGTNDNYDLQTSHVLPALMRKFIEATRRELPSVEVWGSGKPLREFMHVDDLADACVFVMRHHNEAGFINIGTGQEVSIGDLARRIMQITGYSGQIIHDPSKPDGTPRKIMDNSRLTQLGWSPGIDLDKGLAMVYAEVKDEDWGLTE